MDAQPIWSTMDFMQAEAACEQLRAHGIKCASVETPRGGYVAPPYWAVPAGEGHTGHWDVIVAPDDVERATEILRAWPGSARPVP